MKRKNKNFVAPAEKAPAPLVRVKSKFNSDEYYYCKDFPTKIIDGQDFVGVKRNKSDREVFYMKKGNIQVIGD